MEESAEIGMTSYMLQGILLACAHQRDRNEAAHI